MQQEQQSTTTLRYVNSNELDPLEPIHSPLFPSFLHQTNPPRLELEVFDFAPPPLSGFRLRTRGESPFASRIKSRAALPPTLELRPG